MRPWRAGVSLAVAAAPWTWALVTLAEHAKRPEADPVAVVWSERSAFVGRALVVAYVTAALATALTALARRVRSLRGERAWRAALGAGVVGALVGVAGWR